MSSFSLTPLETRVLGCLLEKERLTPENYPLSLNSVATACNQSTNRDPVVSYDDKSVEAGLNSLREKKLASVIFGAGSRVQKYRHKLLEHYELTPPEVALLCVLLLRGPQTPGELRSRSERMHPFETMAEVESRLDELARGDSPLIRFLDARPGQKERRVIQLLSAEVPEGEAAAAAATTIFHTPQPTAPAAEPTPSQTEALAAEVAVLRTELEQLREEFRAFRAQF
ncbi:MAG: YceH family protein [Chthoniobacter sp.]|uniref:YceH family protein n=1 Tax=Chthoniobacter sp. TaxID=2510640 RepID=UPI0032A1AD6A